VIFVFTDLCNYCTSQHSETVINDILHYVHSSSVGSVSFGSLLEALIQGDHSPGKHGKVRELDSGQGKVRENRRSQEKL